MTRRYPTLPPAVLAVLAALALAACAPGRAPDTSPIVPRVEEPGASQSAPDLIEIPRPRISLPAGQRVIALIEARLDADTPPEQVIALKRPDDVASPVRLVVADASPSSRYSMSWQSETAASSARVFDLSTADVVGDHGVAILAGGMNGDGQRTLDVFRVAGKSKGQGLVFSSICRVVADDIRIDRPERPESYTTGQKNGDSYSITALSRDPDSRNPMDLVRVVYQWKPADGRYVQAAPEKIPAEKIEQKQLEKLYTSSDAAEFEGFLDGPWLELKGADNPAQARAGAIIHFQPSSRRISFSTGDTEEVYIWRESLRTLYDRLLVIAENERSPEKNKISRTFSVRASSLNTLDITNQGTDSGDVVTTVYTRVTDDISRKYLDPQTAVAALTAPLLEGAYLDNLGRRLVFATDRVTWVEGTKSRVGACVFFTLYGKEIVSVRFFDAAGSPAETAHFAVDLHEKQEMGRIVRTLVLTPVQLRVSGIEEAVGAKINLEQTSELPKK